ncbi:biotin synthase [Dimargaris xerosporica]|nr:biotin synthase [Dimargaris xerosporica]
MPFQTVTQHLVLFSAQSSRLFQCQLNTTYKSVVRTATRGLASQVQRSVPADSSVHSRLEPTTPLAAQFATGVVRHDWTRNEIAAIYDAPIMDLLYYGAKVHRENHPPRAVQQCTLLSIKTGGCAEDCKYCPQSSRYQTTVKAEKMLTEDTILTAA